MTLNGTSAVSTPDRVAFRDRVRQYLARIAQHIAFDRATAIEARGASLVELEPLLGFRVVLYR